MVRKVAPDTSEGITSFGVQRRLFSVYAGTTSGDVISFTVNGCVLRDIAQVCNGHAVVVMPHDEGKFVVGGGDGTVTIFDPKKPPTVLDAAAPLCQLSGSVTSVSRVKGYDQLGVRTGAQYIVPLKRHGGEPELLEEATSRGSRRSLAPPEARLLDWEEEAAAAAAAGVMLMRVIIPPRLS